MAKAMTMEILSIKCDTTGLGIYHYEKIEEAKIAKKETIFPQVRACLDKLDAIVEKNGGFLVDCGQVGNKGGFLENLISES